MPCSAYGAGASVYTSPLPGATFRLPPSAKRPQHWQQPRTLYAKHDLTLSVELLTKMRQHEKAVERAATCGEGSEREGVPWRGEYEGGRAVVRD